MAMEFFLLVDLKDVQNFGGLLLCRLIIFKMKKSSRERSFIFLKSENEDLKTHKIHLNI